MNYSHNIKRKLTKKIKVGNVEIGGDSPISVQTMTNTLTHDIESTLQQIHDIEKEGCDIVRVSIPDEASSKALKSIIPNMNIPLIADIHFHYKRALEAAENGAHCLRINPGNIGSNEKIKEVIEAAKQNNIPIRIGVNAGSLEKQILDKFKSPTAEALFESAKLNIRLLEDLNFDNFKISVKASNIFTSVESYKMLSDYCNYPLHLGITEAGSYFSGSIKSSIGLGMLLYNGIGDTVRVSLSDHPTQEVKVGFEMLKSLNLRDYGVTIISCPSCARQQFDVIKTVKSVESKLSHIKKPITVSIIGCVVNGPGEATMTNIGITGGGNNTHMVYVDGKKSHRIQNENLVDYLVEKIEEKVELLYQ
ncbi:MAG: flavodoxin-dependent (E)-4-hydroxy-3-methylbut-2-enyl-diphosphate synthase [alpha proteobacterium HIMB59]|jgi:(E)-4-hydroxy-3-methylbut-2-enyl-diphosphate synthase|nr:MAG: flavodoxin-dependent (E)-4-hydroxy-3-methylbut-2-enyl-diphosphate synthase [alpha proteobacterium HIMB59]|tara:strand:- start:3182 stop:4270 length:1089 start_codon:yes stop_codon:yes gene_type:complete